MADLFLRQFLLSLAIVCVIFGCTPPPPNVPGAPGTCLEEQCKKVDQTEVACPTDALNECTGDDSNCTGGGQKAPCECYTHTMQDGSSSCFCSIKAKDWTV